MPAEVQQFFNILVTAPGNLAYHIVLAFTLAGALQAALFHWQRSGFPQGRRLVFGLGLLLVLRLALFVAAAAAWQGLVDAHLLPPLERGIALLSLIVIVWLWVFPEPLRSGDAATILLALLAFTMLALGLVWWSAQGRDVSFNGSMLDSAGEIISLGVVLLGILALLVRRPNGWGYGFAMLAVIAAGHLGHLFAGLPAGDYSGVVRLAQMIAYPILLVLPQRFTYLASQPARQLDQPERRRYGANLPLVQSYLALASDADPADTCLTLTRAVANTLLADLCILVSPPDEDGQITVRCAYDLIREVQLEGAVLNSRSVPVIESTLQRGKSIRLPASSTSPDLLSLSQALHLEHTGPLMVASISGPEGELIAGLVLLSPYSNRNWLPEDEAYLEQVAISLAHLLHRSNRLAVLQREIEQARQDLTAAQSEAEQARQDRELILEDLAYLKEQVAEEQRQVESLTALVNAQEEARLAAEQGYAEVNLELERLHSESDLLEQPASAQAGSPLQAAQLAESDHPEGELRLALQEIARLRSALAGAAEPAGQDAEWSSAVAAIADDLRQPASSLRTHTQSLLSEREGLSDSQRKTLERILVTAERLGSLVGDLSQVVSPDTRSKGPEPEAASDLEAVIAAAVADTEDLRAAKNLSFEIQRPQDLPAARFDPAGLHQVLVKLLRNASLATPANDRVILRMKVEKHDSDSSRMLIQVSDHGTGIPAQEISRLFSGQYPAIHPAIPGLGESPLEFARVKHLVEAMDGNIWVDSEPGVGSSFNLLLPLLPSTVDEAPAGGRSG